MRIEVLTIGDEVLSGTIADTNFAWIGQELWGRGLDLHRHMTVGDEPDLIAQALLEAGARSDLVVVTGGLGPTIDDITLESAARAFGRELVLDEPSLLAIQDRFRRFGRVMSPTNRKQAMLPEGGDALANPVGTAPGCRIANDRATFFFLPGVPAEMKTLFAVEVLPWLDSRLLDMPAFAFRILRCFGMPEATIQEAVQDLDLAGLDLAFRPTVPEVLLKLSVRGLAGEPLDARVEAVADAMKARLGDVVYAIGEQRLPALVLNELSDRGQTLATLDLGTGGALAMSLHRGHSTGGAFPDGGSDRAEQARKALVEARIRGNDMDPVPENVADLASGIRHQTGATHALVLAQAGDPGEYIAALAGPGGVETRHVRPGRNRVWSGPFAAWSALAWLKGVLEVRPD